jgi:hypothetical protein
VVEARADARGTAVLPLRSKASGPAWSAPASPPPSGLALTALPAAPAVRGRVPPVPVGLASDTFNGTTLSPDWQILNGDAAEIEVSGGALHLRPLVGGAAVTWFADDEGVFVHKRVTGDFSVRSRARASSLSSPGQPPPAEYRLGGILVRDPASAPGDRNSLHLAVGAGSLASPVAVEDKSTDGSVSAFFFHDVATPDCELRIRRKGARFTLEYRESAGIPWILARVMIRPDLPATVQVGAMAYSFEPGPDLEVTFDEIVFEKPL